MTLFRLSLSDLKQSCSSSRWQNVRSVLQKFGLYLMVLVPLLLVGSVSGYAQQDAEEISFDDAIKSFYDSNYDLLISRYEIDKSYADHVGSKLFYNPRLMLDRTGMDTSNRLANGDNTQDTIRLEQLIETGGKRGLRISAASETLEAAKLTYRDTVRNLLIGFYVTYYNLHQDMLNRELARAEVKRFSRILSIAEKRYEAGFLSRLDYTKLKLSAVDLENNLTALENQFKNNSEYFGYLLGKGKPIRPKALTKKADFKMLQEEDLLKVAYENRYDLLALERQIKAAVHNVALAKAMRIPDVTVGAEWEKYSPNYNTGIGLGLSFDIPVFNRRQGEILRRGAEQKQMENQMIKMRKQILLEVRQALNNYGMSSKIFEAYQSRKDEMDDLLERTDKSFTLGGITVLELLDTQKTYREFQTKYHQSLSQSNLNRELINIYTGTIK